MKKILLTGAIALAILFHVNAQSKFITKTGQVTIFSHTVAEDITASNNNVAGVMNTATGDIGISVPVQSFSFEKALMQEHFNSEHFMNSKDFPRITLKGKITNLSSVDFNKNGEYPVEVTGDLTIRNTTKPVSEKATVVVENGKVTVNSKFTVKDIGSYGVGKPKGGKKNNVADDIEVTYKGIYEKSSD
ncbi:MAG TPA: YceI family protein [Puia sp.]|nr:YceI family protein [Puia sp.]